MSDEKTQREPQKELSDHSKWLLDHIKNPNVLGHGDTSLCLRGWITSIQKDVDNLRPMHQLSVGGTIALLHTLIAARERNARLAYQRDCFGGNDIY